MKVWFAGETAQESLRFGVQLVPGENEFPEELAKKLIACGLVSAAKRAPKEAKDERA